MDCQNWGLESKQRLTIHHHQEKCQIQQLHKPRVRMGRAYAFRTPRVWVHTTIVAVLVSCQSSVRFFHARGGFHYSLKVWNLLCGTAEQRTAPSSETLDSLVDIYGTKMMSPKTSIDHQIHHFCQCGGARGQMKHVNNFVDQQSSDKLLKLMARGCHGV